MRRGFTLVELMVTLAVLAALLGVAVPYLLSSLPGYRVSGAVRQLVGDFRLAKATAVDRGKDVLIHFHDPAANQYRMALDNDGDKTISAGDEIIETVDIPSLYEDITFGSTDPAAQPDGVTFDHDMAIFHPGGGAEPGSVYLRPSQDAGVRRDRERKVTVTAATGRAKAYSWEGGGWE